MFSSQITDLERLIRSRLAKIDQSVSHDHWHLDRVLGFAKQLQSIYGGDLEIIMAATLLHDLGRNNPKLHGQDSIEESVNTASEVLREVGLPTETTDLILDAIREHDQPELLPSTVEGKILKEADFLAGFGAWGVLRIAMWSGETNGGVPQVINRLEERMPKRMSNLVYVEGRRFARRDSLLANLFLAELNRPPVFDASDSSTGAYLVLEGISGSGKDTQANLLASRLEKKGRRVLIVNEPTERFRHLRDAWGPSSSNPVIQQFFLLADRYELITQHVKPALARGDIVVSVRSFISTAVYQHNDVFDTAAIAFVHRFVPTPDIAILLDSEAETAHLRCANRSVEEGREISTYERLDTLRQHRDLYLQAFDELSILPRAVVNADQSVNEVAEQIWQAVCSQVSV